MRSLRFALALLLAAPLTLQAQAVKIAIMPLSGFGLSQDGAGLAGAVRDMLITELKSRTQVEMIERAAVDELMKSRAYSMSGGAKDDQMREIGQMLGAQYYVGGVIFLEGDNARLDLRLVNTETAEIPSVFKKTGSVKAMISLVEEAGMTFSLVKAAQRIAEVQTPVSALFAYSRGLDYEKRGNRAKAAEMFQQAIKLFPDHADAKAALGRLN